jgi:branched-chain amino acid transport system substrate-binding protein
MSVWRSIRGVMAVVATAALLAACGGGGDSGGGTGGSQTFNLLAVLSVSGPQSQTGGIPARQALEAGIEILNKQGGIKGRQIKLTVVDSASDSAKGVANLQAYLADNDKPDAVFGGQYSGDSLPQAPVLTQAELLSFSSSVTPALDNPAKFPYVFRQSVPIDTIIDVLAAHLVQQGYKTIGYAAGDDESGHSAVDAFTKVAQAKGLTVVPGFVPAGSVDATATLERIRAGNPDALVLNGIGAAAATLLKARTALGWTIPAIGDGSAFAANDLGKISSPADWGGVTVEQPNWQVKGSSMLSGPAFQTFLDTYKAKQPITVGMGGLVCLYENLVAMKAAYEGTDKTDAASLAKALEGYNDTIPQSIAPFWIGTKGLGFSPQHHTNRSWGQDDFTFVPAQALVDGMASATPQP